MLNEQKFDEEIKVDKIQFYDLPTGKGDQRGKYEGPKGLSELRLKPITIKNAFVTRLRYKFFR